VAAVDGQKPLLRRPFESAQYVSIKYSERLAEAGIEPSVGSVGDSYDNALAETVIGLFKSFTGAGRGVHSRLSNSQRWNGWTGSTITGSWSRLAISRRSKPN
jgi:transposase InsO family protein